MERNVLALFLQLAAKFLPFPFNALVGVLLTYLLELVPATPVQQMLAAPQKLKEWLNGILNTAVNEINSRILKRMVRMLIPMVDVLADELWDKLFEQNIVAHSSSAFPGTAPPTAPETVAVGDDVLAQEALEDLKD